MKQIKAADFDRVFDEGEVDVLEYFDLTTASRPGLEIKRVNVDLPKWMVDSLDREAARIGVARQAIIKVWLDERLARQSGKSAVAQVAKLS
ncbi:MAG: ribbon-helix-helix domain-containing protein [Propionibacteriaceae bacterium]|nr:ribbon-helix-helix domain-containing protein [Propionibacteriaceae bacterium]